MSHPTYEEVPYGGRSISATAPAALALCARVHGGPRPSLEAARVLELGCGDGANLLALAFHHPDWTCVGVDSSPLALESAERDARELGLTNVRFLLADVATLELREPEFDFVLAHGIYSWVDARRRLALRRLIHAALSPRGLAYVSFNAQPAWGVRGRVRDVLVRGRLGLESSRDRASALRALVGEPAHPWAGLLAHELERVVEASDAYLAHEYLAADNEAFWLGDVVAECAEAGLGYVGDALFDRPEGFVSPELREAVEAASADRVEQEELIDLVAYRQMRAAVLCRDDAEREAAAGSALLDDAWIAGVVRASSDPFDLDADVEETFVGPRGTEVRVRAPLAKMALLVLANRYPQAFRFDALCVAAQAQLATRGIRAPSEERAMLRSGLYALWGRNELELRVSDAPLRTTPGERPAASALSRQEAARGRHLTTPTHAALPLEPIERAIVAELDGARTRPEVV
jgi:SAM-dependent methyltransferase